MMMTGGFSAALRRMWYVLSTNCCTCISRVFPLFIASERPPPICLCGHHCPTLRTVLSTTMPHGPPGQCKHLPVGAPSLGVDRRNLGVLPARATTCSTQSCAFSVLSHNRERDNGIQQDAAFRRGHLGNQIPSSSSPLSGAAATSSHALFRPNTSQPNTPAASPAGADTVSSNNRLACTK